MRKKRYMVHNTRTKRYTHVIAVCPKKAVEMVCGHAVTKIYSIKGASWFAYEKGTQSERYKEYVGHYGPVSYYR